MKLFDRDLLYVNDGKGRLSIIALAVPLFFESLGTHIIGIVQTVMSSHYLGGYFVNPMNVAATIISFFTMFLALFHVGMSIILSINLGRKQYDDCKKIIGTAAIATVITSFVLCVACILLAEPLLSLYNYTPEDEAFEYALKFLRLKAISTLMFTVTNVLSSALRCYGYTKVGLYCTVSANLLNALLLYIFLFIVQIPMESAVITYAAIEFVSLLTSFVAVLTFFIRKKLKLVFSIDYKWFRNILRVGFPGSISSIAYTFSQVITTMIIRTLSDNSYQAKIYISQIVFFVYVLGFAIGQANAIMIGRVCGQGDFDKADRMQRQNLRIVILLNAAFSLLFALFSRIIMQIAFAPNEEVLNYASVIFFIDTLVEIGRGANHVGQNGLNAAGDTVFTTIVSTVSCWVFAVGASALFVFAFDWDVYGIWIAFAFDELFRATLCYIRWRQGGWKKNFLTKSAVASHAQKVLAKKI